MSAFDITGGGSGGGVSGPTDTVYPTNWNKGSFNVVDSDGKVISNAPLNSNGQTQLPLNLGAGDVGQKNITSYFTGNSQFTSGSKGSFNMHVADKNGKVSVKNTNPIVTQIVAGPGIYISAPNGQGVVTISTSPLNTSINTDTLYDIVYTVNDGSLTNTPNQFLAVGANGANLSSRDGHNWVNHARTSATITCVSAVIDNGVMNFNGVGSLTGSPESIYGQLGQNGDSMSSITSLNLANPQTGEVPNTTFAFVNSGPSEIITNPQLGNTGTGTTVVVTTGTSGTSTSVTFANGGAFQVYFNPGGNNYSSAGDFTPTYTNLTLAYSYLADVYYYFSAGTAINLVPTPTWNQIFENYMAIPSGNVANASMDGSFEFYMDGVLVTNGDLEYSPTGNNNNSWFVLDITPNLNTVGGGLGNVFIGAYPFSIVQGRRYTYTIIVNAQSYIGGGTYSGQPTSITFNLTGNITWN